MQCLIIKLVNYIARSTNPHLNPRLCLAPSCEPSQLRHNHFTSATVFKLFRRTGLSTKLLTARSMHSSWSLQGKTCHTSLQFPSLVVCSCDLDTICFGVATSTSHALSPHSQHLVIPTVSEFDCRIAGAPRLRSLQRFSAAATIVAVVTSAA